MADESDEQAIQVTEAWFFSKSLWRAADEAPPPTDEDRHLMFEVMNHHNYIQLCLRHSLKLFVQLDPQFTLNVRNLDDESVFRRAESLIGDAKFGVDNMDDVRRAIEVLSYWRGLRHNIAHWWVRRSPVAPVLIFLSSDAKKSASRVKGVNKNLDEINDHGNGVAFFPASGLRAAESDMRAAIGIVVRSLSRVEDSLIRQAEARERAEREV